MPKSDYQKYTSLRYDMKSLKARLTKVEKTQSKQYAIKSDMEKVYDNEFNRLISEGDPEVHMQKIIKEMDNKEYIKSDGKILQGWDEKTGEIVYFGTRQQPFGNMNKWKNNTEKDVGSWAYTNCKLRTKICVSYKGKGR